MEKSRTANDKRIIKRIGNIAALLAMVFVIARMYHYRGQITDIWNRQVIFVMLGCICICAALVILASFCYLLLARVITGKKIQTSIVVTLYVKSNLYKYLPGNVMHYVGRNQIAVESEATHPEIIICTLTEMCASCAGGLFAGLLFSYSFVKEWLSDKALIKPMFLIIIGLILVGCLAIALLLRKNLGLRDDFIRIIKGKSVLVIATIVVFYVCNQMVQGILFVILLRTMGALIAPEHSLVIAGVYAFAWLIGFVTPGAPGGLGIREAMLSIVLEEIVSEGILTTAIIINRMITICGDILAFTIVSVITQLKREGSKL